MAKKRAERVKDAGSSGERGPSARIFDWRRFDPAMIADDGAASLADELATYHDRLQELLRHEGQYVLIKGHEVIGIYPDREQALHEAVDRFRTEPVLVKQIVAREPVRQLGH